MIKIILKSYDRVLLNTFIEYLKVSNNINSKIKLISLPNKTKKITLLRSPHVYKKAKDQYQETTHKIVLEINKNDIVLSKFVNIIQNLPKSIFLKILFK